MKTPVKIISFILILGFIYLSLSTQMPFSASKITTNKTAFSTERALIHLKEITQKPHYVGTKEHQKVRKYVVSELEKLGLSVEIQTQTAMNKKWRGATKVKNILAKIKGSEQGKALLLLSHYDSAVHSSYGASDAGSGVVAILESVRAFIASNKQPKNDIIILISDAEEIGLLGAVAFVKHHKWAKDVGLVLNFEARGSGGPSYMLLETNTGNKKLIQSFKNTNTRFPVGNSLMYSIYKMLPNDTDLTVFREDGNINGFNFAFIDDHFDYHTSQDTYENLDRNTLEHQGDYLMHALNHYAFVDLDHLDSNEDQVFFSFQKVGLISYPFSWINMMLIIAFLLFIVIIGYGIQKRQLEIPTMLVGFIPFLSALIVTVFVAYFGWKLILLIHPQYNDILQNFTYNGHWYIAAFSSIAFGLSFWIYKRYFRIYTAANLLVAPIVVWGILNLLIAIYLKGAAYFIIPVYITLIMFFILLRTGQNKVLFNTLLTIPTILIFIPLIKMFPVGLGLKMLGISAFFITLLFGLFIPVFKSWGDAGKLAKLFIFIGFFTLITASFTANYSKDRKQPVSLNYIIDTDTKKAYFASYETHTTNYNKHYLGEHPTQGSFNTTPSDSKYHTNYQLYTETPYKNLREPSIYIEKDTIIGSNRMVNLQIIPQRKTNRLELIAQNNFHLNQFSINGETLKTNTKYVIDTSERKNIITYYITESDEILNISLSFPKQEKPQILVYDIAYDLFTNKLVDVKPRIDKTLFPKPFVVNDATIIKKQINF